MLRIILFTVIVFLAFSAPLPLFFIAAVFYCFFYVGYELLLVSVLVDVYYLNATHLATFPLHTLGLGIILVLYATLRPYIVFRA